MISNQCFPPATCHSCRSDSCRAEWHEYDDYGRAVVVWQCQSCGRAFETVEECPPRQLTEHELVHTFLPNLLVG